MAFRKQTLMYLIDERILEYVIPTFVKEMVDFQGRNNIESDCKCFISEVRGLNSHTDKGKNDIWAL